MQSPSSAIPRWNPAYTWIIAVGFLAFVLTASGIESWRSHRDVIEKTAERTQTISHLIAEWLSASFALNEHILRHLVTNLDPVALRYPSDNPTQHRQQTDDLIAIAKSDPAILFLGLFDAQCTITHTSRGFNLGRNFKEWDYCRLVFQEPIEVFKISPLFIASDGKMNVTISYPVLTLSQEIAGFALMGLDLHFFQRWLERLQPTEGLVISIFDVKQQLLARLPPAPDTLGKPVDSAVLRQFSEFPDSKPLALRDPSPIDNIDRIWSFRRVDKIPLIVVAGLPTREALAAWWTKFLFYYVLGNLTLAALLIFGTREFNRNYQLACSMADMACTDPLTGLANRRRFMEVAGFRLEEARRYRHPFAIILMDLDHFKRINDHCGHSGGDAVLRAFADLIQRTARINDCMARWGGEEFIALLPNTQQPMAVKLAQRLRMLTAEIAVIPDMRVTVSMGVSEYHEPDTVDTLIKRADEALYRAKQQGRDQVQSAL